jgi:hypothetical protein
MAKQGNFRVQLSIVNCQMPIQGWTGNQYAKLMNKTFLCSFATNGFFYVWALLSSDWNVLHICHNQMASHQYGHAYGG